MGMWNEIRYVSRSTASSIRNGGVKETAKTARNYFAFNVLQAKSDFTQQRFRLSEALAQQFNYTVRYGPFAGMSLNRESWWSAADRGAMMLGIYEQEVLEALDSLSPGRDVLIDVGAADGYYAIGSLKAGWVSHAYCFEMSEAGREVILANAKANGVADQVTVLGEADINFLTELVDSHGVELSRSIIIVDIEGSEFGLLTQENLDLLRDSCVIVELHEFDEESRANGDRLINSVSPNFKTSILTTGGRDLSRFPELDQWPDDDRWMLCSESRAYRMRWLVMEPT